MKTTVYASPPSVETVRAWVRQMDPGIELVFVSGEGCFVVPGFGYMINCTGGAVDHLEGVCRAAVMLAVEKQNAEFNPRRTGRTI